MCACPTLRLSACLFIYRSIRPSVCLFTFYDLAPFTSFPLKLEDILGLSFVLIFPQNSFRSGDAGMLRTGDDILHSCNALLYFLWNWMMFSAV
jgi:hypothetical protein